MANPAHKPEDEIQLCRKTNNGVPEKPKPRRHPRTKNPTKQQSSEKRGHIEPNWMLPPLPNEKRQPLLQTNPTNVYIPKPENQEEVQNLP